MHGVERADLRGSTDIGNGHVIVFHLSIGREPARRQSAGRADAEPGKGLPDGGTGEYRNLNPVVAFHERKAFGEIFRGIKHTVPVQIDPGIQTRAAGRVFNGDDYRGHCGSGYF